MLERSRINLILGGGRKDTPAILIDDRIKNPCTFTTNVLIDTSLPPREAVVDAAARSIRFEFGSTVAAVAHEMLAASLPSDCQNIQLSMARSGRLVVALNTHYDCDALIRLAHPSTREHLQTIEKASDLRAAERNCESQMVAESLEAGRAYSRSMLRLRTTASIGLLAFAAPLASLVALPVLDSVKDPKVVQFGLRAIIGAVTGSIPIAVAGRIASGIAIKKQRAPFTHARAQFVGND